MITVGIIGGAGYTAGELIRLIINHPNTKLDFVYSTSNAGNAIHSIHQDLIGTTVMNFSSEINPDVDVVFLCLGHGNSTAFLNQHTFSERTKIIDLSNDFRLKKDAVIANKKFVYGLTDFNKNDIKNANYIANPGCFATAIQLAILPLSRHQLIQDDIHINATTGATGAGTSPSATSHFPWRDNNFSSYKVFSHQHLGEIGESITALQPSYQNEMYFIPNRGNFSRGIYATAYTHFEGSLDDAIKLYQECYQNEPFTFISDSPIHLKQVVNTNKCLIHLHKNKDKLIITSVIDNLLKGASGQAVENMNLIFKLPQQTGLDTLKANYF